MTRASRLLCLTIVLLVVGCAHAAMAQAGDPNRGAGLFRERCALCHINEANGGQGPNLNGVFGRRLAATEFAYSPALQAQNGVWDSARLDRYLESPADAVSGTSMALAVPASADRTDLIAYLMTLDTAGATRGSIASTAQTSQATHTSAFGDWRRDRPGRDQHLGVPRTPDHDSQ